MAGRWGVGSIADIDLKDAGGRFMRVDVIDGENLKVSVVASSVVALDFTVHSQVAANSLKGIRFGIHIALLAIDTYNDIVDAIEAAMLAAEDFNVVVADADNTDKVDDINVGCVVDYQASSGKICQRGALSNKYVKDVVFRFISTGS